jgi:signal transduction histidine kinase
MVPESALIRAEPHAEVGKLLERDADTLVELWCMRAVEEQPSAKRVHHEVLRDHFGKFLRSIGKALRARDEEATGSHQAAEEHGEQRWENGWSLVELVRDYQIMQLVVLEHCEQMLRRPLGIREMMAIGVFIDDAIAASISAYASNREQAALEEERRRAAELEEISRRKDEFLAMLGHELRNPLAPILTASKVIQSVSADGPKPLLAAVEMIERQSRHLVRLVDDILDIARIGRGRFELRKELLSVSAAVHQALEAAEPMLKERNQQLTARMPADAIYVEADISRLVQVITNLLNNASKYTEVGGQIWLTCEHDATHAIIRVRDNGIGIPEDMLGRVFDLFTQVEGSEPRSDGGMGIGLTLVRRLVEQHGGEVTCYSSGRGQGSEFTVKLPLASGAESAMATPSGPTQTLRVQPLSKSKSGK